MEQEDERLEIADPGYDLWQNPGFGLELVIMSRLLKYLYAISLFSLSFPSVYAQEKRTEVPPAQVVVSEVTSGMIAPEAEFIGTVFYQEVSDVSAEVNGKIEEVFFEEGDRIKKGKPLVRLDSELLKKTIESTRASYEQVLAELESSNTDMRRVEGLYREGLWLSSLLTRSGSGPRVLKRRQNLLRARSRGLRWS